MGSSMQLYRITITNQHTNATPSEGFIDANSTEFYYGGGSQSGLEAVNPSSTLAATTAKRRGNLRFEHMLQTVQLLGNCYVLPTSIVTDATAITEGSQLSFLMIVEHGEQSLQTRDETAPGQMLVGIPALVRALARGLSTPCVTASYVFDPTWTNTVGIGSTVHVPRYGSRLDGPGSLVVGPYALNIAAAQSGIAVVPLLM